MSRLEVLHDDKGLAFGKDHVCGDFLMIWKRVYDSYILQGVKNVEREMEKRVSEMMRI